MERTDLENRLFVLFAQKIINDQVRGHLSEVSKDEIELMAKKSERLTRIFLASLPTKEELEKLRKPTFKKKSLMQKAKGLFTGKETPK